jgi:hypothetical protein
LTPEFKRDAVVEDKLLSWARRSGVADDSSREQVEEHCEEEPALSGADLRHVTHPDTVGSVTAEVSIEQVRRRRELGSNGGRPLEALLGTAPEAFPAHQASNALATNMGLLATKGRMDTRGS